MRDSMARSRFAWLVFSIGALLAPGVTRAADYCDPQPPAQVLAFFEEHLGARRESEMSKIPVGSEAPEVSFIDSPSATCFQPDATEDVCWINWYYTSVDAGSNFMICMYTMLNSVGKVSRTQGFFQTSMYLPFNMYEKGFKVPCGALGSGGEPSLGAAYTYTIRARDSAGLSAANYGTVYCPAYVP